MLDAGSGKEGGSVGEAGGTDVNVLEMEKDGEAFPFSSVRMRCHTAAGG